MWDLCGGVPGEVYKNDLGGLTRIIAGVANDANKTRIIAGVANDANK